MKFDTVKQQHRGIGFCEYVDPDVAASALRNLKNHEIHGRTLKVNYASENKSGTNLLESEVLYRDRGEVVNSEGGQVDPANGAATVEDVFSALTVEQEHMLLYSIKEAYIAAQADPRQEDALVEALAKEDGQLLEKLQQMYLRVQASPGFPNAGMPPGTMYHHKPMHSGGGPTYSYQPGTLHNF